MAPASWGSSAPGSHTPPSESCRQRVSGEMPELKSDLRRGAPSHVISGLKPDASLSPEKQTQLLPLKEAQKPRLYCMCGQSRQSTLHDFMDHSPPGSSVYGIFWNELPCPPPGNLLNSGTELAFPVSSPLSTREAV